MPAREVAGQIGSGTEPSEVDDPAHTGRCSGHGEVRSRSTILVLEAPAGSHRVDEVVGDVDPFEGRAQRVGVEDVAGDDLGEPSVIAQCRRGLRERHRTRSPRSSSRHSKRPPTYPVAPVNRTRP